MIPGFFIIIAVLAFNFMGDALRDATDPFSVQGRSA
jgi:peptide/nickel transport system permease protein